jgi:glycosyltransferase involved in cell wall biosynthesis
VHIVPGNQCDSPDITVILATYNRAKELTKTLEGMVRSEKRDLAVEFVVVDNGSNDQTKAVVKSFSKLLKMNYLFEPRSGKNRALNYALENSRLGKIVVFTDDDVDVSLDWVISIRSVCDRWPNHAVFGGRINVVFPTEKVPKWTSDPYLYSLGLAHHSISNDECIYPQFELPFGPNYWVRREVFENGRRFDEEMGPHPTNRIMNDETSFLVSLQRDGYEIVYSPLVIVGHRVQAEMIRLPSLLQRGYQQGRGEAHLQGLPRPTLLRKRPAVWRIHRGGSIIFYTIRVLGSLLFSEKELRPRNAVENMRKLGYRVESMRLADRVLAKSQDRP